MLAAEKTQLYQVGHIVALALEKEVLILVHYCIGRVFDFVHFLDV
jgi:hypothetical protein